MGAVFSAPGAHGEAPGSCAVRVCVIMRGVPLRRTPLGKDLLRAGPLTRWPGDHREEGVETLQF